MGTRQGLETWGGVRVLSRGKWGAPPSIDVLFVPWSPVRGATASCLRHAYNIAEPTIPTSKRFRFGSQY